MKGLGLLWRGLWWRRGLTFAVLAVAVVTTTAAALGPLYARAAAESTLHDELTQAGSDTWLHFQQFAGNVTSEHFGGGLNSIVSIAPDPKTLRAYPRQIRSIYTPDSVSATVSSPKATVVTRLLWREGQCRHVVIVAGHCARKAGEAMVSQRTAAPGTYYKFALGKTIHFTGVQYMRFQRTSGKFAPVPASMTIVGVYRPKNTAAAFWVPNVHNYFDAHPAGQKETYDTVDAVLVPKAGFSFMTSRDRFEVDVDYPLATGALRLSNLSQVRSQVARLAGEYGSHSTMTMSTGLPKVLDAAAHQRSLVDTGTLLVVLQLGLLGWLVLFQVVADAVEARGSEIALSKLRGHGPAATVRFGLGEPVALLVLAVPIGIGLAVLATHGFATAVLAPGTPVVVNGATVLAAVAAFAGGLLAAVLAARRTLTRSVLDQWRRVTHRAGRGRRTLLVDAALAAAAVAGLVLLRTTHRSGTSNDTAALLAPGLLVFAVALLGVRLLPLACRLVAARSRGSRRLGTFLAIRQIARRPAGLRLAALLAVALGLASFAVAGESIAAANRSARAQGELGAPRVASIQRLPGHDPVAQVRAADPHGRWAMAAATWLPDGGVSVAGWLLAVDPGRLAAVAYPARGGPSPTEIAQDVTAADFPPLRVTGTAIRARITATGLSAGPTPTVVFDLLDAQHRQTQAISAPLRAGTHDYTAPLRCRAGCMLTGLTWSYPIDVFHELHGTLTVTGVAVRDTGGSWSALDAGLGTADAWRAVYTPGHASDHVTVTAAGVRDEFRADSGADSGIAYAIPPDPMPAVAVPRAVTGSPPGPKTPTMIDITNSVAHFQVKRWAPVLPNVLDNGVVVNVNYVDAQLPAFADEAAWQVWIGPDAPPDALARLKDAGLIVQSVHSEHARASVLARQGPALALLLLLVAAIAGAVLAVGGTAISVSAASRARSYELAALRTVGVPRRALLRASVIEQLLLLGTAVVLGVPSGLVAAWLAMPVIPEFATSTPVALAYGPHAGPSAAFTAGFVALLVITAFVASWALLRAAVPARLREAEA